MINLIPPAAAPDVPASADRPSGGGDFLALLAQAAGQRGGTNAPGSDRVSEDTSDLAEEDVATVLEELDAELTDEAEAQLLAALTGEAGGEPTDDTPALGAALWVLQAALRADGAASADGGSGEATPLAALAEAVAAGADSAADGAPVEGEPAVDGPVSDDGEVAATTDGDEVPATADDGGEAPDGATDVDDAEVVGLPGTPGAGDAEGEDAQVEADGAAGDEATGSSNGDAAGSSEPAAPTGASSGADATAGSGASQRAGTTETDAASERRGEARVQPTSGGDAAATGATSDGDGADTGGDAGSRRDGRIAQGGPVTLDEAAEVDGATDTADDAEAPEIRVRTERATEPAGVRVDARPTASDAGTIVDEPVGVTQAEATTARAAQAAQAASSARSAGAAMVERILEAATRLENQPPPRTLTLELGEARVRLSMEDGTLRLSLLGEPGAEDRDLLQDASEQLRNRGFDLGDGRGEAEPGGEHAGASAAGQRRGATSTTPTTGVAGRSTTDLRL